MHMPRHHVWSDICPPPTPASSPENSYRGHYSLVCVIVGMVIFWDVCLWRGKCLTRVAYKHRYDLLV